MDDPSKLSVMENSNTKISEDHIEADEGNEQSEYPAMDSEEPEVNGTISIMNHLESYPRASSSSSTSSKDFLEVSKDFLEVTTVKESNSTAAELEIMTVTQSPPLVQVMNRNGGYDPNRIPASVFERSKSDVPADWSSASNESLFSIHAAAYGDIMKSGELFKSGELLAYSPAFTLPSPMVEPNEKTADTEKKTKEVEAAAPAEVNKENKEKMAEKKPALSWKSPTTSYRSQTSTNSANSFSFPILAEDTHEAPRTEAEEHKAQPVQATPEANQNQSLSRWFSCSPRCPWCCSCNSSCPCSFS